MKVIIEKDVNFICDIINGVENRLDDIDKSNIINLLQSHIQEIDTLTVSKLRPMCDAPINILILSKYNKNERFISVGLSADSTLSHYEGWIPMPIYKPELTGNGEKTAG